MVIRPHAALLTSPNVLLRHLLEQRHVAQSITSVAFD